MKVKQIYLILSLVLLLVSLTGTYYFSRTVLDGFADYQCIKSLGPSSENSQCPPGTSLAVLDHLGYKMRNKYIAAISLGISVGSAVAITYQIVRIRKM